MEPAIAPPAWSAALPDSRVLAVGIQDPAPATPVLAGLLGSDHGVGEAVLPFPRLGGIDEQARVEAALVGMDGRIEGTAPGAVDDAHVALRIAAGHDRPEDVVHRVDV